jgi:CRISPR-associated protein (TIGR02710 family)
VQVNALNQLHADGIQLARRHGPALELLRDPARVLPILGSLHSNAFRRQQQGRYDVAALLRYRCLELMAQQRLATYSILMERPEFDQAEQMIPDLESRYRAVSQAQGRRRFHGLPDRAFGLFVGYMLLAALDDPLVQGYAIGQIEERSRARNKSILAHGYRLITADEYALFSEVVDAVLTRFFVVISEDRAAWEKFYQFVAIEGLV